MEIKETDKYYIITPLCPKLAYRESTRLNDEIELLCPTKRLGIDMSLVKDCTIDFIKIISRIENINLFNIQSDIFAIITSMGLDKKLNLYVSEYDFVESKHRLLNRKFSIV